MRFKVELHAEVVWFIRHCCNKEEVDAFYEQLERLRAQPIENSEPMADPDLSRYMLRFFRFRRNLALFEYDPGKDRIRVLECRRIPPRRGPKRNAGDDP